MDIAKVLLKKLTKEELSVLCDSFDDGSIDDVFDELLPVDMQNYPEKYNTEFD